MGAAKRSTVFDRQHARQDHTAPFRVLRISDKKEEPSYACRGVLGYYKGKAEALDRATKVAELAECETPDPAPDLPL